MKPKVTSREDALNLTLDEFLAIVIGEDKELRVKLVGTKSSFRGLLISMLKMRRGRIPHGISREEVDRDEAIRMWHDMREDPDIFFGKFEFKRWGQWARQEPHQNTRSRPNTQKKKKPEILFNLSLRELAKLSLTEMDFTYTLNVPAWRVFTFLVFHEIYSRTGMTIEKLKKEDFSFGRELTKFLLNKTRIQPPLSEQQKQILIECLSGRGNCDDLNKMNLSFTTQLSKLLTAERLRYLRLENKDLAELLGFSIDIIQRSSVDKESICLSLLDKHNRLRFQKIFTECPLKARCLNAARKLARRGRSELTCVNCPFFTIHRDKYIVKDLPSHTQSAIFNSGMSF